MKNPLSVFLADRRGAVAILTAIAMIPLLLVIGGGVDYMRVMAMRSDLQQAVDTAALAAMASQSDASQTAAAAAAVAENYIHQNFLQPDVAVTTSVDTANMTATVSASANVPTTLLGLIDIASIPISATATATMGASAGKPMEVALVFDVTTSMNAPIKPGSPDIKILTAKASAIDLVTKVSDKLGGRVRFGLVPFSQSVAVNVPANQGSWWLDRAGQNWTRSYDYCSWITDGAPTCTKGSYQKKTCYNDGVSFDCSYYEQNCTGGTKTWVCKNYTHTYYWKGCLGVRAQPLDAEEGPSQIKDAEDKTPQAFLSNCDQVSFTSDEPQKYLTDTVGQLRRLADYDVTSAAAVKSSKEILIEQIKNLKLASSTDLSSGLLWGWNVLSPLSPWADGKPYGEAIKVMVFLTDGANASLTSYPDKTEEAYYQLNKKQEIDPTWPENLKKSVQARNDYYDQKHQIYLKANDKALAICSNIKARGIRLYTIAFGLGDTDEEKDARALLEKCASSSDHYFKASDKAALDNAFSLISLELTSLRLIK